MTLVIAAHDFDDTGHYLCNAAHESGDAAMLLVTPLMIMVTLLLLH